jgi:hypothetical protein
MYKWIYRKAVALSGDCSASRLYQLRETPPKEKTEGLKC